jgi:ABC-type Fe3+/spermidine/putrescine transport system ATPase subunit
MLSVKNIFKDYENQPLLRGVSFDVQQGETVCLLGRSGSGKSTILRIIAGIEKPEKGEIFWNENSLQDVPVHKRKFGFMFQDYALFPHKNVFDNVAFGLNMQDLPAEIINSRVDEILKKVKLEKFAHRQISDLSGGEQQRVAFARALAPEPRLLMLDEPLGALDRTLREQLMVELRSLLHETQVPAIYVTHDQEEAFTIGDRLILLNEGKIIQNATPQNIYHHPENAWVAEFFGLTNLIKGELTSIEPTIVKTEFGELNVSGQKPADLEMGNKVTVLIRPEGLIFDAPSKNKFNVLITDDVFLGTHWKVELKLKNYTFSFIVDDPINTGTKLDVGFSSDSISILEVQA